MCCCVCATVSYRIFPTLHVRAPMWAQNGAANLPGHTGLYKKKVKCLYNLYVYLNNYPSIYRYLWYICLSVHPSIHPSTHMDVYNTPICIQYICNWSVIVCTHAYNYIPHMHTAANMYTCMHVCTVKKIYIYIHTFFGLHSDCVIATPACKKRWKAALANDLCEKTIPREKMAQRVSVHMSLMRLLDGAAAMKIRSHFHTSCIFIIWIMHLCKCHQRSLMFGIGPLSSHGLVCANWIWDFARTQAKSWWVDFSLGCSPLSTFSNTATCGRSCGNPIWLPTTLLDVVGLRRSLQKSGLIRVTSL